MTMNLKNIFKIQINLDLKKNDVNVTVSKILFYVIGRDFREKSYGFVFLHNRNIKTYFNDAKD